VQVDFPSFQKLISLLDLQASRLKAGFGVFTSYGCVESVIDEGNVHCSCNSTDGPSFYLPSLHHDMYFISITLLHEDRGNRWQTNLFNVRSRSADCEIYESL